MITTLSYFLAFLAISTSNAAISDSYCYKDDDYHQGTGSCLNGDVYLKGTYVELGIHMVGSFGASADAPPSYVYGGQQLGFIADFDKNGFDSPAPGFAGDYFVPGSPLEGWSIQFTKDGVSQRVEMHGLDNDRRRLGSKMQTSEEEEEDDFYTDDDYYLHYSDLPTDYFFELDQFDITSTENKQSANWVGTYEDTVKVDTKISFENDDLFIFVTVSMENIGDAPLSDVWYMRTIDPDQEAEYYDVYSTRNYVKYQRLFGDATDAQRTRDYVHPTIPNACVICAAGNMNRDFFLALGTASDNCYVNHFGFGIADPVALFEGNKVWMSYGGNDLEVTDPNFLNRTKAKDETIYLGFKYPTIQPGETVKFSYFYGLNTDVIVSAVERSAGPIYGLQCSFSSYRPLRMQIAAKIALATNKIASVEAVPNLVCQGECVPYLQASAAESFIKIVTTNSKKGRLTLEAAYQGPIEEHLLSKWETSNNNPCTHRQWKNLNEAPVRHGHDGCSIDISNIDVTRWADAFINKGWLYSRPTLDKHHFEFLKCGSTPTSAEGVTAFQELWNEANDGSLAGGSFDDETVFALGTMLKTSASF